jgi:hypothetical protein
MNLNLRARIRAISLDTGEVDPPAVAEKLLGELSPEEQAAALHQILPDYVRGVLGAPWPAPNEGPPAPGKGAHRGPQVKAAYYAELQRVWDTPDGQKRFRDCGTADLDFLAAARRSQAAELIARAEEFDRAKAMLTKHDKEKVGALPTAALDFIFGGRS